MSSEFLQPVGWTPVQVRGRVGLCTEAEGGVVYRGGGLGSVGPGLNS